VPEAGQTAWARQLAPSEPLVTGSAGTRRPAHVFRLELAGTPLPERPLAMVRWAPERGDEEEPGVTDEPIYVAAVRARWRDAPAADRLTMLEALLAGWEDEPLSASPEELAVLQEEARVTARELPDEPAAQELARHAAAAKPSR
jgi:hypothetical protein